MKNKKIYICRKIDQAGINKLDKIESIETKINKNNLVLTREDLIKEAEGAEAIITLLTDRVDGEVMDKIGKQLKIIANYAVGFDNIDTEAATKRGITVTNTPEVMTQAVAEHAITLILACARRIVEGDEYVRADRYKGWEPELLLGPEIAGKKIGIVGLGRIGESLAKIGYHGFGMKILYHDLQKNEEIERNLQAEYTSLNTLLENSDFVSLHVPLNDATRHLIGEQQLKMMKKNAILVNTSRGAIIDEKALIQALKEKEIFAAGLDVFESDSQPTKELYELNNVILTPHIASATNEARAAMSECACENVIEVLMGRKPKNPVN
jgi:glyoxylate reductase